MVEIEGAGGRGKNRFTNINNVYTYTVCHLNLVIATVMLMHGELLQFPSDVIGGPRIEVPVGIRRVDGSHSWDTCVGDEGLIKYVLADAGIVTLLEAHL
jgi:hypothetical protein